MARNTKRHKSEHLKYGICLNDECPKCKEKVVQQMPMRKEFVCEECGKELYECPPPKPSINKKLILFIVIVVIAIGGVIAILLNSDIIAKIKCKLFSTCCETGTVSDTETDTNAEVVVPVMIPDKKQEISSSGVLSLSYGEYHGETKKGYPHGQGRLTYTTTRVINHNDSKQRKANPGDYIIGRFFNGFALYVKHYNSSGELLETLTFGASEDSYESK